MTALDEQDNPTVLLSAGMELAGAIDEHTLAVCQELWQSYEEKGLETPAIV